MKKTHDTLERCADCEIEYEQVEDRHFSMIDGLYYCEGCCPHPECETYHTKYRFESKPDNAA